MTEPRSQPSGRSKSAKVVLRVWVGVALLAAVFGACWGEAALARTLAPGVAAARLPSAAILALLAAVGAAEAAALLSALGLPARRGWCALGAALHVLALVPGAGASGTGFDLASAVLALWVVVPLLLAPLQPSLGFEVVARRAAGEAFALLYVPFLLGFLVRIRALDAGGEGVYLLLAVVLATKSSDIFAYLTGVAIGRHKAIPRVSPGKTWEGFVGGALGCMVVGLALFHFLSPAGLAAVLPWSGAVALAVTIAVLAPLGDLAESVLKRAGAAKDSGALLPEFGGVLDLIDSLVVVAPAAYLVLALAGV